MLWLRYLTTGKFKMDYVDLTEEAMESIRGRDLDEPIAMINLLKFRDVADPALGLEPISGRDCYFGRYIAGVPPIANRLGTGHSPLYLNDVNSCFFATVGGGDIGLRAGDALPHDFVDKNSGEETWQPYKGRIRKWHRRWKLYAAVTFI